MKHKPIPKDIRIALYEKYNHRCAYCGCELKYKDMQVDHITAKYKGGVDSELNYLPACRQCNFYKSTFGIDEFRERLKNVLMPNLTGTFQFRLAEKYGLVEKHDKDIKFYFEEIESWK